MTERIRDISALEWHGLANRLDRLLDQAGEYTSGYGLCYYLRSTSDEPEASKMIFEEYCVEQGLDTRYPVLGGRAVYWQYADDEGDLWDTNTAYGQARWDLVSDFHQWVLDILEGDTGEG